MLPASSSPQGQRPARSLTALLPLAVLALGCTVPAAHGPALDGGSDTPGASDSAPADRAAPRFAPPPGFMDPAGERALLFEFRGWINGAVTDESEATLGQARARALIGEGDEQLLEERALSYVHVFGPESGAALAGKRLVAVRALQLDWSAPSNSVRALMALVGLRQERLRASAAGRTAELGAEAVHYGALRRVEHVRREDGVALTRDCVLALWDEAAGPTRVLVDGRDNQSFGGDEPLLVWGNLPLVTDTARLGALLGPTHELADGRYCTCVRSAARIACADWDGERQKSGAELSCAPPAELFAPRVASRSIFTFKGPLNGPGAVTLKMGIGTYDTEVSGAAAPLDYMTYAERLDVASGVLGSQQVLDVTALGALQPQGSGRWTYNALKLRVPAALAEQLQNEGRGTTNANEAASIFAALYRVEHVDQGQGEHLRLCPFAVSAGVGAASTLHFCPQPGGAFAVGDPLELAGQIALTDAPAVLATWFGSAGTCTCAKDGAAIPCSAFPSP